MTTGDALLAAIKATPDDNTPRLIYADWIEGEGFPVRAELIRLSCKLHGVRDGRRMRKERNRAIAIFRAAAEDNAGSIYPDYLFTKMKAHPGKISAYWDKISAYWDRGFIVSLGLTWSMWVNEPKVYIDMLPMLRGVSVTWPRREEVHSRELAGKTYEEAVEILKKRWPNLDFSFHQDSAYL